MGSANSIMKKVFAKVEIFDEQEVRLLLFREPKQLITPTETYMRM